jgi:hypothetical protein
MLPLLVIPVAAVIAPVPLMANAPLPMLKDPPCRPAVVVIPFVILMLPNPLASEPAVKAPVPVMLLKVPACRLALVTVFAAMSLPVTSPSRILSEVTASAPSLTLVTAPSAILPVVTALFAIVATAVLLRVMSPLTL